MLHSANSVQFPARSETSFLPRLFHSPDSKLNLDGIPNPIRHEGNLATLAQRLDLQLVEFTHSSLQQEIDRLVSAPRSAMEAQSMAMLGLSLFSIRFSYGQHRRAAQDLGLAHSMALQADPLTQGIARLTMGGFLQNVGMTWGANTLLRELSTQPPHPVLGLLAEFDLARVQALKSTSIPIEVLESFRQRFLDSEMPEQLFRVELNVGRLLIRRDSCDEAEERVQQCLEDARESGNARRQVNALFILSELCFAGHWAVDRGVDVLEEALDLSENAGMRAHMMLRIAGFHARTGDDELAESFARDSYNEAHASDLHYLLPEICCSLAHLLELLERQDEADLYYKEGYLVAREILRSGFDLCAYNLDKAISRYVDSLQKRVKTNQPDEGRYLFARDSSLAEIREMFQAAYLSLLMSDKGSLKDKAKKSGVSRQSLLKYRKSITTCSLEKYPGEVLRFIRQNRNMSWSQTRNQFEQQVLNALFLYHGRHYGRVARALGISESRARQIHQWNLKLPTTG